MALTVGRQMAHADQSASVDLAAPCTFSCMCALSQPPPPLSHSRSTISMSSCKYQHVTRLLSFLGASYPRVEENALLTNLYFHIKFHYNCLLACVSISLLPLTSMHLSCCRTENTVAIEKVHRIDLVTRELPDLCSGHNCHPLSLEEGYFMGT